MVLSASRRSSLPLGCSPVLKRKALLRRQRQRSLADLPLRGLSERPLNLQISDLEKMPRVSVDVKDHNGKLTTYEGVALAELLKAAGAPIGEKLRGANMASYVLAEAKDGYRVVFALPKLDSAFTDSEVLVAYAANGKPLPDG